MRPDDFAEAHRRRAGRRDFAIRCASSPISPRQYSFDEIARHAIRRIIVLPHVRLDDVPEIFAAADDAGPRHAECRPHHRHLWLPRPRLLRAGHCALDPDRAGDRRRISPIREAEGDRRVQHQDLRLHQRLRPSSCRQYRHSGAGEEGRGILPDHHRRRSGRELRARRIARPRPAGGAGAGSDRQASSRSISRSASRARASSKPIAASASRRSRPRSRRSPMLLLDARVRRTTPSCASTAPKRRRQDADAAPLLRSKPCSPRKSPIAARRVVANNARTAECWSLISTGSR